MKYITKKLVSEVNRLYYTNYQKTDLKPVSKNPDTSEVFKLSNIANKIDEDLYHLYTDLLSSLQDHDFHFMTEFAINLEAEIKFMSYNIRIALIDNETAYFAATLLLSLSLEVYLVGGTNRDIILGETPKDFDFATDAPYDKIKDAFENHGFSVIETGKSFSVLKATRDGEEIDIANFRKDIYDETSDGRHPSSVEIGTMMDDAMRRDFTVNALFYDCQNNELLDPTGQGIDDANNRALRFVGKPKDRIQEDFLRVYRFFRFMKTKDLTPVPAHLRACRDLWADAYLKTDPQRALLEIERM